MLRKIIKINEALCNGCGLCAQACHEGAIKMIDGKAKLLRDDYCDGLGDCLPVCPTNAISFENREAAQYDEQAVLKNKSIAHKDNACACPGSKAASLSPTNPGNSNENSSQLSQWPVQIKLVPPNAPFFQNADLLIAADCTAFAYGDFHNEFIKDHITLIGCPKLDDADYSNKLFEILHFNDIESITVVRMQVPCCGGIVNAVNQALEKSQKNIPLQIFTISTNGKMINNF